MFHPSRIEEVETELLKILRNIDLIGSVKIYLCFFDEYMIPREDWRGFYPCSNENVSLDELIMLIKKVYKGKYIIRHNVILSPFPGGLIKKVENQEECEKYIEVCLIQDVQ